MAFLALSRSTMGFKWVPCWPPKVPRSIGLDLWSLVEAATKAFDQLAMETDPGRRERIVAPLAGLADLDQFGLA